MHLTFNKRQLNSVDFTLDKEAKDCATHWTVPLSEFHKELSEIKCVPKIIFDFAAIANEFLERLVWKGPEINPV